MLDEFRATVDWCRKAFENKDSQRMR